MTFDDFIPSGWTAADLFFVLAWAATFMQIGDLPTPALVLDKARLLSNINRMTAKADALGVALRPHLKTAKSAAVATLATDKLRYGITVSTLKEAEYFAEHGFLDITYAVGIVPGKLDQAAALLERGVELKIITDCPEVAAAVAAHGAPFDLLAEIDCGDHRAGVQADGGDLLAIGAAMRVQLRSDIAIDRYLHLPRFEF